jgi:hypothetical protein
MSGTKLLISQGLSMCNSYRVSLGSFWSGQKAFASRQKGAVRRVKNCGSGNLALPVCFIYSQAALFSRWKLYSTHDRRGKEGYCFNLYSTFKIF